MACNKNNSFARKLQQVAGRNFFAIYALTAFIDNIYF
jgi:hypothetical protein